MNIKRGLKRLSVMGTGLWFIEFSYFVAIPEFYPKPAGQQIFTVKAKFPENRNSINITDEEVEVLPYYDNQGRQINLTLQYKW